MPNLGGAKQELSQGDSSPRTGEQRWEKSIGVGAGTGWLVPSRCPGGGVRDAHGDSGRSEQFCSTSSDGTCVLAGRVFLMLSYNHFVGFSCSLALSRLQSLCGWRDGG